MPRLFLPPLWLRPLVIIVLVLGIFFRFVNIDRKVFWHDEVFTALNISGNNITQTRAQIFTNQVIDRTDLQKYQKINPDKNIIKTITSLATDDPHHPPLYYILARVWAEVFGDSITSLRIPSIIISLLVLPLAYWFCWELFNSSLIAWLAVSFFAVSPFQVLYAQEAREYSLLAAMVLLVNVTFLVAIRRNNMSGWVIHGITLAASYYTSIFAIPVAVGQGVYTLIQNKFKPNQITVNYFFAGLISITLFSPWLWVMFEYRDVIDKNNRWRGLFSFDWTYMIQFWTLNISRNFADIFLEISHPSNYIFPIIFTLFLTYSIYFLVKNSEQKTWLLLITLLISPVIYLIIPDIIMGTIVSHVSRYFIPWYIAIPIIFAYLISQKLSQNRVRQQRLWQIIFLEIITLSIISCTVVAQSEAWWNKGDFWWKKSHLGNSVVQGAKIVNQGVKPLVIIDRMYANFGDTIALSHRVNDQTKFELITTPEMLIIPPGFSNIYFYNPSDKLTNKLKAEYGDRSIKTFEGTALLELDPPSGLMVK